MFRVTAGLPSTAQPLGGWESPHCRIRGPSMGHFDSAEQGLASSAVTRSVREEPDTTVLSAITGCNTASNCIHGYGCFFGSSGFHSRSGLAGGGVIVRGVVQAQASTSGMCSRANDVKNE